MKVVDILRTLLFQIKNMIATWIVQFPVWLSKKLFKKLLVLRNHVTFVDHMKILSQSTLVKVADILRTLLFQIKNMILAWICSISLTR